MSITVYSKPKCVQCTATYRKLDKLGLEYSVIDVTEHEDTLELIKLMGHQQAPVVVVTGEDGAIDHWSGYVPDKLEALA